MRAAIYARKSTDQVGVSEDSKSVARQVEHARQFAEGKGWQVAESHIYIDDGVSGAEFANRPAFVRLMNSLEPKAPFDVLVAAAEDRLGRESIETSFALKQLVQAGVRVFFYLENRERTLDSPMDKVMLSLATFADELERDKSRQRTKDALVRKAKAGHVTGGSCFGYRNVPVLGPDGDRSHVEREVIPEEAKVVQRIFELCAGGYGQTRIAKTLNEEGAPSPTPRRKNSPKGWAPSSVRSVLYRDLYRGLFVWNKSKKRDRWGQANRSERPASEHIEVEVPEARIVSDAAWEAAHAALQERSRAYLRHQDGKLWGRPPVGVESKYLLVNLARCGYCGGGLEVRSSSNGQGRKRSKHYGCATYYRRGKSTCSHRLKIPMELADSAVLDVMDEALSWGTLVRSARQAFRILRAERDAEPDLKEQLTAKLRETEKSLERLTQAVASGAGEVPALAASIKATEEQRQRIESRLEDLDAPAVDEELAFSEIKAAAMEWREILGKDVEHARQILKKMLAEKLAFTEETRDGVDGFRFEAAGTFTKILSGVVSLPQDLHALVSPTGFEPVLPAWKARWTGRCS